MSKHALLSPSGAERWLMCTPSPRFELQFEEPESLYADEGTLAHSFCNLLILQEVYGADMSVHIQRLVDEDAKQEQPFYDESMYDYALEFAKYVAERYRAAPPNSILLLEYRVNLSEFVPEGFGTTDVQIVAPGYIEVIDFKYGKGVPVDAYENNQMMVYAIGGLREYDLLFDITNVIMTIYQPRIENISTYEITVDNLLRWGREVLKPTALRAFQGVGELVAGDHCKFCRARAKCVAAAKLNMELAKREFSETEISDEQLVKILKRVDSMKSWLNGIEKYALQEAIKGRKWPGLKVVAGRSQRKYTDEEAILSGLIAAGYEGEQLVNKKLLGVTKIPKIVSKLHFKQLVEPYIHKPGGSPTLVSEEDGRPEWSASSNTAKEFLDYEEVEP